MELSMVTIDAHWQELILIDDGKQHQKCSILLFMLLKSYVRSFRVRQSLHSYVISMGTLGGRTFSCMETMNQRIGSKQDYSLLSCLNLWITFHMTTHGSQSLNQRSLQPGYLSGRCLKSLIYLPWKHPSVGLTKVK